MAFDRFMIAPEGFSAGLVTDKKSFLIPDEAFETLENCYVFRGRVTKRFGSYLMGDQTTDEGTYNSRLSVFLGTTDGGGNLSGTVPGAIFGIGQAFTIGSEIFTVNQTGTPANMLKTGATATATYNTNTGAYVFAGAAANTAVYFYSATPVMGIITYESGAINNQPTYAFDRQFAYVFMSGSWTRSGTAVWTGSDDQLFWAVNYFGVTQDSTVMFVTNFNPADDMWYFDGTTWAPFSPLTIFLTPGNYIKTARIIIPFKNRLLLLNTVESTASGVQSSYTARCRYSHVGSPLAVNAWLEPDQTTGGLDADGGGFLDATTEEQIVSAEFIKDRLLVYFERSTWELVYTNNNQSPFLWQKINTELGSEATFSTVPFDKVVLTIGNTGVHACSGSNVERIDNKIPQKIFDIEDKTEGVKRIYGIRDYFTELVYWTFPATNRSNTYTFPNKILVYNYQNSSWAFNDDTITAFGYFEQQSGTTWESTDFIWDDATFQWVGGATDASFRQVIAGNQEGYIFIVDPEYARNASALQITDMTLDVPTQVLTLTVINHNISGGSQEFGWVMIENVQGMTGVNGLIMKAHPLDVNTIELALPVGAVVSGTYTGGGTLALVSNILIQGKQWNPYLDRGQNVYVSKIDFGVAATIAGEITVEYTTSTAQLPMVQEGIATGAIMGNGILETSPYALAPLEQWQTRLWHPLYFQSEGECIQIVMYFSDDQMKNPNISQTEFELEGMVLHCRSVSTRLQ